MTMISSSVPADPMMNPAGPIPWAEFRRHVLERWSVPVVSKGYARRMEVTCDELEALDLAVEGESPRRVSTTADLTVRLIALYRAAIPGRLSVFTVKRKLAAVQSMCQLAFENRWVAINPFHLRRMSRWVRVGRPRGKRHLTREECRRLLRVLEADVAGRKGWALFKAHRLRVVVSIALWCGLRKTELLRLQVGDVDLAARMIQVQPHGLRLKTDRSADSVPIPDALVPILQDWLSSWRMARPEGFRIDPQCPWLIPTLNRRAPWTSGCRGSKAIDSLKRVGARAGIEHITLQMLRRTCATMLEAHGVSRTMIARILRHSVQVDDEFYRGRDDRSMLDAARGLDF